LDVSGCPILLEQWDCGIRERQPPTVSAPSKATVDEDASLVFASGNGNAITVTDAAALRTGKPRRDRLERI